MENSRKLIQDTKKTFVLYTFIGIGLVSIVSYFALNLHSQIVSEQATMQAMYSMISRQLNLVSRISSLSETFDERYGNVDEDEVKKEFSALLTDLNLQNAKFNQWLKENEFSNVENIEELLDNEDVDNKILLFIKRARELVDDQTLSRSEIRKNIKFLSSNSRQGLGEVFTFITDKLESQQHDSLDRLSRTGFLLVGLCVLQVVLVWLLVFRPLYSTIMIQHQKIIDALLKAESANRSKTDFLANISHEIRTPMTAIMGYADLLKREEVPTEDKKDAAKIIDHNASHLLSLIDEILDLSKIESGKFDFEKQDVDLSTLLNEVYSLVHVKAEDKGIELIFKNRGPIPKKISSDSKRLKQILFNILGNAIKFTDEGFVELLVSFNQTTNTLKIRVKDTGVGIARDQIKKLFRPFEQLDSSARRRYGGTGLGLVLSRNLARGMGGDVQIAESQEGIGTTFEITFDVGQVADQELITSFSTNVIPEKLESSQKNELLGTHILVVDDAKENARLFKMYLAEAGASVEVAHDGQKALDIASKKFFDIVLLDLQMPGKDGFQVIHELRDRSFNKPVVALTAHAMKEQVQKTKEAGFDGHITKPVRPNDLIGAISRFVQGEPITAQEHV